MRILHIVSHYVSERATDGVSAAASLLIRGLRRIDADVTLFTVSPQLNGESELVVRRPEGAMECYFRGWRNSPFDISGVFLRECLRRVKDFDIVHIHGLWRYPSTCGAHACRHAAIPYVLSPHGMLNEGALRFRRYRKLAFWHAIENRTVRGANWLHFTTEAEQFEARGHVSTGRASIVPIGLDLREFEVMPPPGEFRARHGISSNRLLLAFLGRIHPKKGLDVLLHAMRRVAAEVPDIILTVCGPNEDGYQAELEELASKLHIESNIRWIGPIHGLDKLRLLRDMDLFVFPSLSENFGIAAVEAMAAGRPVVLGRDVNIAADVETWNAGWCVDAEPGALASTILSALWDRDGRCARAEAARRLVVSRYSMDAMARNMMKLYENCLNLSV